MLIIFVLCNIIRYIHMWVTCIKFTAHETRILRVLEELRTILESLNVKINTLLRNSSIEEQDQGILEGINFPLNNRNDIASLESKLLDPIEEKKVVRKLGWSQKLFA